MNEGKLFEGSVGLFNTSIVPRYIPLLAYASRSSFPLPRHVSFRFRSVGVTRSRLAILLRIAKPPLSRHNLSTMCELVFLRTSCRLPRSACSGTCWTKPRGVALGRIKLQTKASLARQLWMFSARSSMLTLPGILIIFYNRTNEAVGSTNDNSVSSHHWPKHERR
jgi:hypothetical protein